jgi:hypothetical protein
MIALARSPRWWAACIKNFREGLCRHHSKTAFYGVIKLRVDKTVYRPKGVVDAGHHRFHIL